MSRFIAGAAASLLLACGAALAQSVPALPNVQGPVQGPGPIYPGLRPALTPGNEPADFGYVTEEYFVSGTVTVGTATPAYKTRILVRRPADAQRFSGMVVSEVMHSNGFAVTFQPAMKSVLMRGHVQVEIAAQAGNVNTTIKPFNLDRYESLVIPAGSTVTSQIVAQVGRLLKTNLSGGILAPLSVRRLFLVGTSQASGILRNYQSQQHVQTRMPDKSAIVDGYLATSTLGNTPMMVVDVPTVHMPTMTEANSAPAAGIGYRRTDSDDPQNRYRLYEVAGMAHANSRDTISYVPNPCTLPASDFPWGGMVAMGLNRLVDWADKGVVPPHADPIEFDNNSANDGSRLALDEHGNVKGGVRNTYVDVPVAAYGVPNAGATPTANFNCSIAGWRIGYDELTLRELYKNHGAYISKLNRRLMELVREGWMLPEYAEDVRADAHAISIPNPGR
jgi:hypothetical protein